MADVADLDIPDADWPDIKARLRQAALDGGTRESALPAALRASEVVSLCETMDMPQSPKLPKADARVSYRAGSGEHESHRCYDCRFYQWGTCVLVEGGIEATDVCDLFTAPLLTMPNDLMATYAESAALNPGTGIGKDGWRVVRPLTFSASQEWIAFLPPPGRYQHALYGEMDLTQDRLARIVANFIANVYKQDLPINAEHDSRAAGAVGWVREMRLAHDGSIEVRPEWNDRGQALIDGDRFRYVSAEFYTEWQDPVSGTWHQDVAVGLAICVRPHFKTDVLRPLAATESRALSVRVDSQPAAPAGGTDMPEIKGTEQAPAVELVQGIASPTLAVVTLSEGEVARFRALEARDAERERQFAELTAVVTRETEHRTRLETAARVQRFTDEVRGRSDASGTHWLGDVGKHIAHMDKLAVTFGEDSDEVRHYRDLNREHAARFAATGATRPIGSDGAGGSGDATARFMAKAQTFAEEKKVSLSDAMVAIGQQEPQLYRDHVAATRNGGR